MEKTSRFSALISVNVPMECSNNALHSPKNQTQEDSHNLGHGAFIVYPQLRTVLVLNITIPVVCMATKKVAATPSSKVSMSGNRSRWLLLKAAFLRRINATVTNILDSEL